MTIRATGLWLERGGRAVLNDVSFEARSGEIVALLGPNGAGKSTLLAGLAGLIPPSRGRVDREGRTAMALQTPALARRSALANVEAALAWWGTPADQRGIGPWPRWSRSVWMAWRSGRPRPSPAARPGACTLLAFSRSTRTSSSSTSRSQVSTPPPGAICSTTRASCFARPAGPP